MAPTNPADWKDYDAVIDSGITINSSQGLGFMMGTKENKTGLSGFDLDGCRNPQTGVLTDWAQKFLIQFPSYAEVTPSQSGIRIYYSGEIPNDGRKVFTLATSAGWGDKVRIEAFDSARYFTMTGDRIGSVSEIAAPDILLRALN